MKNYWHNYRPAKITLPTIRVGNIIADLGPSFVAVVILLSQALLICTAQASDSVRVQVGITKLATIMLTPAKPILAVPLVSMDSRHSAGLCLQQSSDTPPYTAHIADQQKQQLSNSDGTQSIDYRANIVQSPETICGSNTALLTIDVERDNAVEAPADFYSDNLIIMIKPE